MGVNGVIVYHFFTCCGHCNYCYGYYGCEENPQWKKAFLVCVATIAVMAFSMSNTEQSTDTAVTQQEEAAARAELAKIELKVEAQDMFNADKKQKVVVWITNTSDKTFDGQVSVDSIDVDGKRLGHDLVFIEDLKPGENTYAILWLKTSHSPSFETRTSGEFK